MESSSPEHVEPPKGFNPYSLTPAEHVLIGSSGAIGDFQYGRDSLVAAIRTNDQDAMNKFRRPVGLQLGNLTLEQVQQERKSIVENHLIVGPLLVLDITKQIALDTVMPMLEPSTIDEKGNTLPRWKIYMFDDDAKQVVKRFTVGMIESMAIDEEAKEAFVLDAPQEDERGQYFTLRTIETHI